MPFSLSQRIKYAMAHLSRKKHISLLARPNWRRIQRRDVNNLVEPFKVSRAALRSRASKRLRMMARPRVVNKKYDPTKLQYGYVRIHPKTLRAGITSRVMELALPSKRWLLSTIRYAPNPNNVSYATDLLWKVNHSRYQRFRRFCNAKWQREAKKKKKIWAKLRKALTTPEDWNKHLEALERLAAPKEIPRAKYSGSRRKWRPVNVQRIDRLAQPTVRKMPEIKEPCSVTPAALTYVITERLKEIAFPKHPPEIIKPRMPGFVSPAAKRAVASERILALAAPAVRPAGMLTDLKEDAFTVSPMALKARCSKRIKMLAKPKTYRR